LDAGKASSPANGGMGGGAGAASYRSGAFDQQSPFGSHVSSSAAMSSAPNAPAILSAAAPHSMHPHMQQQHMHPQMQRGDAAAVGGDYDVGAYGAQYGAPPQQQQQVPRGYGAAGAGPIVMRELDVTGCEGIVVGKNGCWINEMRQLAGITRIHLEQNVKLTSLSDKLDVRHVVDMLQLPPPAASLAVRTPHMGRSFFSIYGTSEKIVESVIVRVLELIQAAEGKIHQTAFANRKLMSVLQQGPQQHLPAQQHMPLLQQQQQRYPQAQMPSQQQWQQGYGGPQPGGRTGGGGGLGPGGMPMVPRSTVPQPGLNGGGQAPNRFPRGANGVDGGYGGGGGGSMPTFIDGTPWQPSGGGAGNQPQQPMQQQPYPQQQQQQQPGFAPPHMPMGDGSSPREGPPMGGMNPAAGRIPLSQLSAAEAFNAPGAKRKSLNMGRIGRSVFGNNNGILPAIEKETGTRMFVHSVNGDKSADAVLTIVGWDDDSMSAAINRARFILQRKIDEYQQQMNAPPMVLPALYRRPSGAAPVQEWNNGYSDDVPAITPNSAMQQEQHMAAGNRPPSQQSAYMQSSSAELNIAQWPLGSLESKAPSASQPGVIPTMNPSQSQSYKIGTGVGFGGLLSDFSHPEAPFFISSDWSGSVTSANSFNAVDSAANAIAPSDVAFSSPSKNILALQELDN
jgi:hypothetical protein